MSERINPPIENLDGLTVIPESPRPQDGGFSSPAPRVPEPRRLPFSPVDEQTGVPLPIHPYGLARDLHPGRKDAHHPWHPKRDPLLLRDTLGGQALRHSRIQVAGWDQHHLHYHRAFHGPELPTTDDERFRLVVLTAAGYIPAIGLGFSNRGKPYRKSLTPEQRSRLWHTNQIKVDRPGIVQQFLREYTYRQDLSDINERVIEEFLETDDPDKRWGLGRQLLGEAVYRATFPLREVYKEARQHEQIPPQRAKAVSRFVLNSLGMRRHHPVVVSEFRERLLAAA